MYRIELAPGEETVFRTIEELAVAARNGLVTPRCRIYHNATQKWLPIEFHPHYKQALSLPAARVAEAVAPRTSGHPPPLETLSFAVAPAARPTPVVEPVAEPVAEPAPESTTETRGAIPAAQARPQTQRSPQERKRPGKEHRVEHQGGTARSGAENSATAQPSKERSPAPYASTDHSSAEQSGAGHPGADDLDNRYAVVEDPVSNQPATKQASTAVAGPSVADHSVTHHSVTEPPVTEPPVTKYQATERPVTKHAVTNHPAPDHPRNPARVLPATTHSAFPLPAEDETAAHATMEHPEVEHPAAETGHADMAADMAAESPFQAEPPATPMSKSSSYRPDSYLPPSVRAIADDPYVAIAPEPAPAPAPAPPVPSQPLRSSWTMMPAVQETPELPTISYPEFTPAVEPVAERASSSRGHRPLQVVVAVLVLAAGGYLARSFYSPVRGSHTGGDVSPAATVADRPALPKDSPSPVPTAVTTKPSPVRPAVITPTAPASSGFAAALEPRAIASGPAPILPANPAAAQLPPAVAAADSTAVAASIAPAPAEMQIDVPALPGGDSLVVQPRSKSDSAMKRILRAVNGGKDPK